MLGKKAEQSDGLKKIRVSLSKDKESITLH
jgi:hypothetical protein